MGVLLGVLDWSICDKPDPSVAQEQPATKHTNSETPRSGLVH
jgi:hypothetical protein